MEAYYIVSVGQKEFSHNLSLLNDFAMNDFFCTGVEEFSLNETEVDAILGDRSYSGGDLPEEVLDEVDEKINSKQANKFYFSDEMNALAFQELAKSLEFETQYEEFEGQDWNTSWKENFDTIEISQNFAVIPEWKMYDYQGNAKFPIIINPGQGFGTGSHETTSLCLKLLDKYIFKRASVLDFGSGSGILAIGAYKLGAKLMALYDIDAKAMDNAKENIKYNLDEKHHSRFFGTFLPENRSQIHEQYDVVMANILIDVLTLEKDFLIQSLNENGLLILSGLLIDQAEEIKALYLVSNELELLELSCDGEWAALAFRRLSNSI